MTQKHPRRRLLFLLIVLLIVAGCAALLTSVLPPLFIAALTRSSLPQISDPAALLKDCAVLLASGAQGEIKSNKWPFSIWRLHPSYVQSYGDSIWITTSSELGEGTHGYMITPAARGKGPLVIVDHKSLTEIYPGICSYNYP